MASIYFIRHGQASFGSSNYDKLSPLGEKQAHLTGRYLQQTEVKFDAIYSGSLLRQRETAEQVTSAYQAENITLPDIIIDDRLNELDANVIVMKLMPELAKSNPEMNEWMEQASKNKKAYQYILRACFKYWQTLDEPIKGLEPWAEFYGRVKGCVDDIIAQQGSGKDVAVFTSGGVIAAVVQYALGLTDEGNYQVFEPVINGSITHCKYSKHQFTLNYYNDHSFLRVMGGNDMVTFR
ncbi:MAG: broad specificity phosphatase PhoE [Psychrobacter glaciei]|jgi:broad specificity phosphatase PhoE